MNKRTFSQVKKTAKSLQKADNECILADNLNMRGNMKIKDHGVRTEMKSGSVRDTQIGKPRPDLIPAATWLQIAMQYSGGAEKYNEWNWALGQPVSQYMASALRHILEFSAGLTDEHHDRGAIFNLISLRYTLDAIECGMLPPELDDRHDCQKPDNPMALMLQKMIEENIQEAIEVAK